MVISGVIRGQRSDSPGGVHGHLMCFFGCRGEHLEELHQHDGQEPNEDSSLCCMQALQTGKEGEGEREREGGRERQRKREGERERGRGERRERERGESEGG